MGANARKKEKRRLLIGLILVIVIVGALAFYAGGCLPVIGDASSPANTHVSDYYILHAEEETNSPNMVTAVLADYRGFDTLFETCVLFLAGVVVWMTICVNKEEKPAEEKKKNTDASGEKLSGPAFRSQVLNGGFRIAIPIILLYGVYVLVHGESSLGGGFQAGALFGCAYLLIRLIIGPTGMKHRLHGDTAMIIAGLGTFIYAFTGILCMLGGGNFLEYGMLPFGEAGSVELHSTGILMIEAGVTICVMMVIISILEAVLERTSFDD